MAISYEEKQKEIWTTNKIIEEFHYDFISAKAKTVYANMNNRLNFSYIEYLYGEDLELEINNLLLLP